MGNNRFRWHTRSGQVVERKKKTNFPMLWALLRTDAHEFLSCVFYFGQIKDTKQPPSLAQGLIHNSILFLTVASQVTLGTKAAAFPK